MTKGSLVPASMSTQGARLQFGIAVALISIIPLLTIFYVFQSHAEIKSLSVTAIWSLSLILFGTVCLGYSILLKYPRTIMKMRQQMEKIAQGEIPDSIELLDGESDISAIEKYFNLIIDGMRHRMDMISEQGKQLMHAERQRVMVESLCTACHCLGQPATSIRCYLDLMRTQKMSPIGEEYLNICIGECDRMSDILVELQGIEHYQTESYCECSSEQSGETLKIIQTKSSNTVKNVKPVEDLEPERTAIKDRLVDFVVDQKELYPQLGPQAAMGA